jgi:hypothetical protein
MGRWVIALVAVAAGLAAPSSLAQVVLGQSVFDTEDLPSNTIRNVVVSCPRGFVAASAGISNPAPGVTLLSMRPSGATGYKFRFRNPAANPDRRVTVVAACRSLVSKGATRLKATAVRVKVNVPAGRLQAAALPCPSNTLPAGWGYDTGAAARVSLRRVSMNLAGFSFSLRNSATKAHSVTLYGTCLTALRPAGASRERLHVSFTTFHTPLHPRTQRIVRTCATGWVSLAVGYVLLGSPAATIEGVAAIGAGGRWSITNAAESQSTAALTLVCAQLSRS